MRGPPRKVRKGRGNNLYAGSAGSIVVEFFDEGFGLAVNYICFDSDDIGYRE